MNLGLDQTKAGQIQGNTGDVAAYKDARMKFMEKAKEFLQKVHTFANTELLLSLEDKDLAWYLKDSLGEGLIKKMTVYANVAPQTDNSTNDLARFLEASASGLSNQFMKDSSDAAQSVKTFLQMFSLIVNRMDILFASKIGALNYTASSDSEKTNKVNEALMKYNSKIKARLDAYKAKFTSVKPVYDKLKAIADKFGENGVLSTALESFKAKESDTNAKKAYDNLLKLKNALLDVTVEQKTTKGLVSEFAGLQSVNDLNYDENGKLQNFVDFFNSVAPSWSAGLNVFLKGLAIQGLLADLLDGASKATGDDLATAKAEVAKLSELNSELNKLKGPQTPFEANSLYALNQSVRTITSYAQLVVAEIFKQFNAESDAFTNLEIAAPQAA
ncbi:hypothetical protein [Mycoplasma struthionis]|uniref:Uncharacterized protein n=1 Tax=Mycoplasma struthionis TaxID=538220 RepID=A0A3G8LGT4_9MOLU|nr:hypothetical protein [Mycoplasma struthionis]AZG68876.1 hypothetical protein EGN60_02850 [Mycoplasma struthionis]